MEPRYGDKILNNTKQYLLNANYHYLQKNYKQSISLYGTLYFLKAPCKDFYYDYGQVLIEAKRYYKAINVLEEYTQVGKNVDLREKARQSVDQIQLKMESDEHIDDWIEDAIN